MKDFTKNALMLLCFLFAGNFAFSQTPFWTEEFADSMPASWTALEVAGDMSAASNWVWSNSGPAGGFSIGPIASTSAANGWMLFDSDLNCSGEQDVWLISPQLDLTNNDLVVMQFETFYRRFNDVTWIEVSTDSTNWTQVPVFDGLTNGQYGDGVSSGAANPQIVTMDLTSYAANEGSFWFAFHFLADSTTVLGGTDIGCGYSWQVDDVSLFDVDPTPANDISLGDYFYPPASFAQPVSQIPTDTMGFFADVSNIGTGEMTNVVLKAEVLQADGTVLWVDSLLIPAIDTGVVDSTFFLDNTFVPDQLGVGDYAIRYNLYSLDAEDADMTNNSSNEIFIVTDNIWSKDNGNTTQYYRRVGGPNDYVIGTGYTTSTNPGGEYKAQEVTFSAAKNQSDGNLAGDVANIVLMEIKEDVVAPDWSDFDDQTDFFTNEGMSLRAFVPHTYTTNSTTAVESEMLTDFNEETPGVLLKPGTRYMLLASYEGANNVIFHGFNEDISYFQISTVLWNGGDNQWFLGAFGPEPAAVLRMAIDLASAIDITPLPDNALRFYPNPVSSVLNVDLSLEKPTLANVTIAEMSGRVLFIDEIENANQESLQ